MEDKRIGLRLSSDTYAKLEKSGEVYGLSASRYAKKVLENSHMRKPLLTFEQQKEVVHDLVKQGGNLNQVARWVNIHQSELSEDTANRLIKNFEELTKGYTQIWQQLQK